MRRLQDLIVFVLMCSAFLLVPVQGMADSGSKAPDSIPFFAGFIEKDKAVLADEHALSDRPMASIAASASRIAQVTINNDAIDAQKIAPGAVVAVGLFDDASLEAEIDKVEVANRITTIRGKINGSEYGHIITTVYENKVLTVIELPAEGYQYKIVYDNDVKTHFLYKTKLSELDTLEGAPSLIPPEQDSDSSSLFDINVEMVAADTEATIDVMVVYTPAAASWASANGGINNIIAQAMARAQLALGNSNTLMNMRLVHSAQVAYTESGDSGTDLDRLTSTSDGYMDEVHTWRDQYSADLVAIFAEVEDTGGVGWLLNRKSGWSEYAFCLTRVQQAGWTFTHIHEMGHNMGAHHHKEQSFQEGPTIWQDWSENTWSAGWRWVGSGNYCSIMTYEEGFFFPDGEDHVRVAYFANPSISYDGVATGDATDGDNARTLREIRNVIADYRAGTESECTEDDDCEDDALYCTGSPICRNGVCGFEDVCGGDTPLCDEKNKRCVECLKNRDCADDLFCTGPSMCMDGACEFEAGPCEGYNLYCDEDNDQCAECLEDAHCETFFSCESNECVPFPVTSPFTTVTLKGPGMLDVMFYPNKWDIAAIQATGTTEDSSLTIVSKLKNMDVTLERLDVLGSLKSIKGKDVVLTGTLTATNGIGTLHMARTESGSSITAPWIGKLTTTDYFDGDMTLSGAGSPPKGLTLGKALIKGWLRNSQWLIDGNIGSVKVYLWGAGSILAVGVDPGGDGQFFTSDDVATGGWLKKLDYKYYETENNGEKFGVIADTILDPNTILLEAGDFYIREIQ